MLVCDGSDQKLSLGSAAKLGREPAGIPLLRSQQLCLSSPVVSGKKNEYHFPPSLGKQVQQGKLKLQIPPSLNREHRLQQTLPKKPPGFYSQSITKGSRNLLRRLTLLKCIWGLGERQPITADKWPGGERAGSKKKKNQTKE